ncbi:queuosine-tRNA galactosyltransferase-like isoform X2 [Lineus longissimus]|uniref:queuosine-tRNA galactosyltransferase-like isoform X2 n=1 Tax=Lineus longissimus TaxID=88925 RepID=UPI00315CAC2F
MTNVSVLNQDYAGTIEVSIYNDASMDKTAEILQEWRLKFLERGFKVVIGLNDTGSPLGPGNAKHRAAIQSSGDYICWLDADDVMTEDRVSSQYEIASTDSTLLVGSQFWREPEGSTERYENWANRLTEEQLLTQIYTSNGPTLIFPTWFMSRLQYDMVGGIGGGRGVPDDLIFFYKHLKCRGKLKRIDRQLLMYRYHPDAMTFSVTEESIWLLRLKALEEGVLSKWPSFSIWNAGKQGRKLFRSLSLENQKKVTMFCDVDEKKIKKGVYIYEESKERPKPRISIVHFSKVARPIVLCMKMDLTGGGFEKNLESLQLKEGVDYYSFA